MIKEKKATVYETSDGGIHPTRKEAVEHEFRLAVRKWAETNCYHGMSPEDFADAIIGDKVRLAEILREYML